MAELFSLSVIARIRNDFTEKFGIPRQSGLVPIRSEIVFEPEYRVAEALRGLDGYSHLWLLWQFSEAVRAHWSPTVRPPRLGGNVRMGVFATRSPYRPNPIGLSSVRLEEIRPHTPEGPILVVSGADLRNGTPIYDIKPYLPYTDAHPDAACGFAKGADEPKLAVEIPPACLEKIPPEAREGLLALLAEDPRPGYQDDPARIYKMAFGAQEIRFTVAGDTVRVIAVLP